MARSFFVIHVGICNSAASFASYRARYADKWKEELARRLDGMVRHAASLESDRPVAYRRLDANHEFVALRIDDAAQADRLADHILSASTTDESESPRLTLGIGIHTGEAGEGRELPVTNRARDLVRLLGDDSANAALASIEAFQRLPAAVRDGYVRDERDGETFYRRFASDLPRCFVISPVGEPDDPVRERAGHVFDSYLKPACAAEGYRPTRADQEFSKAIRSDMMSSLSMDPMAIAYLGRPPWNPNVMIEVGYRLAVNNQIVFVRDAKEDVAKEVSWQLPFDLSDIQILTLPPTGERDPEAISRTVGQVAAALRKGQGIAWSSEHAVATIDIGIDDNRSAILDASIEAGRLFARQDRGANVDLSKIIARLRGFMPAGQFEAFNREQRTLLLMLKEKGVSGEAPRDVTRISATIPMFFEGHPDPDFDQRAFLPVIARYRRSDTARVLRLTVLYLDVTPATRVNEQGVFVCHLTDVRSDLGLIFDLYATSYDEILPRLRFYQVVRDRHVAAMSAEGIDRVLEIGAGTGNVTIPLLDRGRKVTAVDSSHSMLTLLQKKVFQRPGKDDRVYVLEQSAEDLRVLPDAHYDGVSIMLALFAMNEPRNALLEAIRLLRPGGTIAITEPRRTFQLKPLLGAAEEQLRSLALLPGRLDVHWRRVSGVNRTIDPEQRSSKQGEKSLRAEDIVPILENCGFQIVSNEEAYLGHCATIIARKS